jgi:shikimate kinase
VDCPECGDEPAGAIDLAQMGAGGLALERTVALVGLMGAGKTTIGRRLAAALNLPFVDADEEIAAAAGLSIAEIFAKHGEGEFRRGERMVIERLLSEAPHILATGGGAFVNPDTRALMKQKAISVWLKAPLDVLMKRVARRDDRPLLREDDPRAVMQKLIDQRYPLYAEADLTVETGTGPHNAAVADIVNALRAHLSKDL